MVETVFHWVAVHGYGIVFVLLALGVFGVPLPDELLLAYLGHLVFKGGLGPAPTIAAAFLGSICGMTITYLLGRSFGLYLVHKFGHLVHITEDKVEQAHRWFEHAGRWGLMIGYFLPGIRHLTAFVAGTSKMSFADFALFAYAGGLIWCSSFITLGYVFEEHWSRETTRIRHILEAASLTVVIVLVLYFAFRKARQKKMQRFRRQ